MHLVIYEVLAACFLLGLFGFLATQLPGEHTPWALRIFAAFLLVGELCVNFYGIAMSPYWWVALVNDALLALILVCNWNRFLLHIGVGGLLTNGLRIVATPEQLRDFIIAVVQAYPKAEAWLVMGITAPTITLRFGGKFCGDIDPGSSQARERLVDQLMAIHQENPAGRAVDATWPLAKLVYWAGPDGTVTLSSSTRYPD